MTDKTTLQGEVEGEIIDDDENGATDLVLVSSDRLAEVISGMTEIDTTENIVGTRYRIVAEMLAAENEDELWTELPSWSSKNNVGKTFIVSDIRGVFKSRYPDADTGVAGGFLACSAVAVDGAVRSADPETGGVDTSEPGAVGILSTSALRIAGKLGWYHQHGKFPLTIRIVKRGESAGGFPILDVEKA